MATQRQIAANRQNATRSTGPRTRSGKAIARLNAITHGLTSRTNLIKGEIPEEYLSLRAAILEEYSPSSATSFWLCDALAEALWRLRRVSAFEAMLLNSAGLIVLNPDWPRAAAKKKFVPDETESLRTVLVGQDGFSKLSRYEAHILRQCQKLIDQVETLETKHATGIETEREAISQPSEAQSIDPSNLESSHAGENSIELGKALAKVDWSAVLRAFVSVVRNHQSHASQFDASIE